MFIAPSASAPLLPRASATLPPRGGALNAAAAAALDRHLALVLGVVTETVVVDLTDVTEVDAGGFRGLLRVRENARARGLDLALINPPKALTMFLKMTRMEDAFPEVARAAAPASMPAPAERAFHIA